MSASPETRVVMIPASLRDSADALLSLDAKGALTPHGIGGLAREIIEAFLALPAAASEAHGPYVPCFIGPGVFAGIIDELPADLVGKSVWVTTTPRAPAAAGALESAPYVIWSNEHRAWWGPNRAGYCWRLEQAGKYSRGEAVKICTGARGGREFNHNPSEVPIVLRDALAFWPDSDIAKQQAHDQQKREQYERQAEQHAEDFA